MTPDTLAGIVARDAACGRVSLPGSALPEYQVLADRRALLALLRETRDALAKHLNTACFCLPGRCPSCDILTSLAALDPEPVA